MARILIIDDDDGMRQFLIDVLTAEAHLVLSAGTGRQGIELARSVPLDLIITDILLPDLDGLEVIRELKRQDPKASIIAITGGGSYVGLDPLQTAFDFGAMACLSKPFPLHALTELVTQVTAPSPS